jgi:hypothetical protein
MVIVDAQGMCSFERRQFCVAKMGVALVPQWWAPRMSHVEEELPSSAEVLVRGNEFLDVWTVQNGASEKG